MSISRPCVKSNSESCARSSGWRFRAPNFATYVENYRFSKAGVLFVVAHVVGSGNKIKRPWFGAKLQRVTPDISESLGLDRPAVQPMLPGCSISAFGPIGQGGRWGFEGKGTKVALAADVELRATLAALDQTR